MQTVRSIKASCFMPAVLLPAVGALAVALFAQAARAADPPRMKRADAFLGVHFDFHAGSDCDRVGARTTPEMVELVLDKVKPDYIQIDTVDEAFPSVLAKMLPEPIVEVTGASHVDVTPRTLNGKLSIHLVNTSGPHANPPDGGIQQVEPVGPLTVSIRLDKKPEAITMQPEGTPLEITCSAGLATVTVPKLKLYSILMVER